jgi:hypothetical protein
MLTEQIKAKAEVKISAASEVSFDVENKPHGKTYAASQEISSG